MNRITKSLHHPMPVYRDDRLAQGLALNAAPHAPRSRWLALVVWLGLTLPAFALKIGWHDQMSLRVGDGVDLKQQSQPKGPPVALMGSTSVVTPNTGGASETVTFAQQTSDVIKSLSINSSVSLESFVFSASVNMDYVDTTTFDANDVNFVFTATRNLGDRYYPVLGLSPDFKAIVANLQTTNQGASLHSAITGIFGTHYVHGYQSAAMVSVIYTLHFASKSEREQLNLSASGGGIFGLGSFSATVDSYFSSASSSRSISYKFYTTDPFQSPTNFNFSTSGNIQSLADFTNLVTQVEAYWRAMDPARAKVTGYILDPIETIPGYLPLLGGFAPAAAFPANYDTFLQSYATLQLWSQRLTTWTQDPKRMNWLNASAQQLAQGRSADVANYVATMQAIATNHFQNGTPLEVPDDIFNYLATLSDIPIPAIYVLDSFDDNPGSTTSKHYLFGWIDCGSTNLTTPAPFYSVSQLHNEADAGVFATVVYTPADFQKNLLAQYSGVALSHAKSLLASVPWTTLTNLTAAQHRVGFFSASVPTGQAQEWSAAILDPEGNTVDELPWLSTRSGGTLIPVPNEVAVSLAVASSPLIGVVGVPLTANLAITNQGGFTVYGVVISFNIDSRFNFVGMTSSQGSGSFTRSTRLASYSFGTLAAGAGANIAVQFIPLEPGLFTPATPAVLALGKGLVNTSTSTKAAFVPPIQIGQLPAITNQPRSQTVYQGTNVTMAVTATGSTPLSYQWEFNGTNLHGATGPTLTLKNVTANQAGPYQVIVTNVLGSITSQVATLTVLPPLQITAGTVSGATGGSVLLPITMTGFTDLLGVQFSLHWNTNVAQFVGVEQSGVGSLADDNFGTNNAAKGTLTVAWDDPSLQGESLPDGAVFLAARFNLLGKNGATSSVTIDGNPTQLVAANKQGLPVPMTVVAGTISVSNILQIAGTVSYYHTGIRVPGVTISLGGAATKSVKTAADGRYSFAVNAGSNYVVTPSLPVDSVPNQGVTIFDIPLIRRHILGVSLLDSPYKIIAADVRGAGSVTTLDIPPIRRVIEGVTNNYPAGVLWQFLPASEAFPDPQHPWPFNTNLSYAPLNASQVGQNFVAIKLGDVMNGWTLPAGGVADLAPGSVTKSNGAHRTRNATSGITFAVGSTSASPNGRVGVPVRVSGFNLATTAQFTLAWDTNLLAFAGVGGFGLPALDTSNFGTSFTNVGKLTFSWDDPTLNGVTVADGTGIFTLQFQVVGANGSTATISFADSPTVREVSANSAEVPFIAQSGTVQVPATAPPRIGNARRSGNTFSVSVGTIRGRNHLLEFKNALTDPAWTPLQTLSGTGDVVTFTDNAATGPTRYYRIRVE